MALRAAASARYPAGLVRVVTFCALAGLVGVALAAIVAWAGTAVQGARLTHTATQIAFETLATVDALDCDLAGDAATRDQCAVALGSAQGLGAFTSKGTRDQTGYTVAFTSTVSGTCPQAASVAPGASRTLTRTATVTAGAATRKVLSVTIPVGGPVLLVPASAGSSVTVTSSAGVEVTRSANPDGCAAFPGLPAGTTGTPAGDVTIPGTGDPR